ncbi:MAG: hypothetical protein V4691_05745 [Pseudomonadota bacterium]
MADPSLYDAVRIPSEFLLALDNRVYHFALQPYHFIVRLVHVMTMGAFLGGIVILDLQLIGMKPKLSLRILADFILPYLYVSFGIAMVTGAMLFFYDPLHVGAHAYFVPKVILIVVGIANAAFFNGRSLRKGRHISESSALLSKAAGAVSLAVWAGVVGFACMNVEGIPKVYLQ